MMSVSTSPMFPDELIDCIAEGRDPTVQELFRVAERISSERSKTESFFLWGRDRGTSGERLHSLQAARLALCGDPG